MYKAYGITLKSLCITAKYIAFFGHHIKRGAQNPTDG
jgi:hypothetical protein